MKITIIEHDGQDFLCRKDNEPYCDCSSVRLDPFVACAIDIDDNTDVTKLMNKMVGNMYEMDDSTTIYRPLYLPSEGQLKLLKVGNS